MNIGQIVHSFHQATDEQAGFQTPQKIKTGYHAGAVQLGNDKIITIDAAIVLANQDESTDTIENLVFEKDVTYVIDFKYQVGTVSSIYQKSKNLNNMTKSNVMRINQEPVQEGTWTGKVMLTDLDHSYTMTLTTIPAMKMGDPSRRLKLIFTPNRDYDQILIKIERINLEDFFVVENDSAETSGTIPCFILNEARENNEIVYPVCYQLSNIISGMNIKRLGIQGFEGMSFSIDGEDFEMGRSGFFSLEGVNISKLACYVPPARIGTENELPFDPLDRRKFFIVDYESYQGEV